MHVTADPVWPWSLLGNLLAGAGGSVTVALVLAGLLTFALPIMLRIRPGGHSPRTIFRVVGSAIGLLLGYAVLATRDSASGFLDLVQYLGLFLLLVGPLALIGLTVWTYLGVSNATPRRVGTILALRLAAFVLAILAVLRPSLATPDKSQQRTLLLISADTSGSMSVQDESNSQTRWDVTLRALKASQPLLKQLTDEQMMDVAFHRFDVDVGDFNPDEPGKPEGKRTDIGQMLHKLYDGRDNQRRLRALLVLSDGADNGPQRFPALGEAARWRGVPCPIHTFSLGKPTTADRQSDIALTAIVPEKDVLPAGGELVVNVTVDAPGFENSRVRLRLFLDDKEVTPKVYQDGKEVVDDNGVPGRDVTLPQTSGNRLQLKFRPMPKVDGEVKVTVRVEDPRRDGEPLRGEVSAANNEIGTFVTVSKKGISVLLVDKRRFWEPTYLIDALQENPRITVYPVWLGSDAPGGGDAADLFRFEERAYDVVIVGDVTAAQFRAVRKDALKKIEELVDRDAGFLMLGGYNSFGNSDWQRTEVEAILPVKLDPRGQVDEAQDVKMVPTPDGLRLYPLRLEDKPDANKQAWDGLPALKGMTLLGEPKPGVGSVLAESARSERLLVTGTYGKGRVLAFGGDTTWRWVRDEAGLKLHHKFWQQVVVWLAKQEKAEGSVRIKPDTRRLPARNDLGFSLERDPSPDNPLPEGGYKVEVIDPNGVATEVRIGKTKGEDRGTFARSDVPGEYRIVVKEAGGKPLEPAPAARFLVYDDEVEMRQRAADHEFLKKLAAAGGGQDYRADQLPKFLEDLLKQPAMQDRPRLVLLPDWKTTGRSAFFPAFLALFVMVLTAEWVLRRRWGLV